MVKEIIVNNTKEFDKKILEYSFNIKCLNILYRKNAIDTSTYERVKSATIENCTIVKLNARSPDHSGSGLPVF